MSPQDTSPAEPDTNATAIRTEDIAELCTAHCHIRDREHVADLLTALVTDGVSRLHVVSDFDHTITKPYKTDGRRIPSSFGVLNMCPSLPDECRRQSLELLRRFAPIERDPHMPLADKTAALLEWWRLSNELHRGFRLPRAEIDVAAGMFNEDCLRAGAVDLFDQLLALGVPVLVFSAGLADGVIAILRTTQLLHANVQVLGNYLVYDEQGDESDMLRGFDGSRIVHAFNKNEHALDNSEDGRRLCNRRNALVMGDSLGDADMAAGGPTGGNVLKIGFLYDEVSDIASTDAMQFLVTFVLCYRLERICRRSWSALTLCWWTTRRWTCRERFSHGSASNRQ